MAAIGHYDQGDLWTPQATFTVGGTPTDPTTLIVRIKDPSGTITVVTENAPSALTAGSTPIARTGAGVYKHAGIALNDAGYWFVRFEGTGAAAATEEHEAIVDPSEFYETAQLSVRALVGLAETKDWLQQQNIDTANDLELARVINDVSDRVHDEAEREFKVYGTNPQTRYFDTDLATIRQGVVNVGDLAALTTVRILDRDLVLETAVAAGDVVALPRNRKPWEPIRQLRFTSDVATLRADNVVEVTGTWGFPAVPGSIRQAVLDAVAATVDRDVEQYRTDLAPVGAAAEGGTTVQIMGGAQRLIVLPRAAQAVAWSYRLTNVG